MSSPTDLVRQMRAYLRAHGPQPFSWFMQQALYHPGHGYYSSGRAVIGRKGDYFTNVSVGPVFGRLLAAQFAEMWNRIGAPDNFVIVEQGAHDAQFACDVLEALAEHAPDCFAKVRYRIVEPFPALRHRQRQTIENSPTRRETPLHAKVEWTTALEPFTGIHFSNELLDSLPVALRQRRVALEADRFALVNGDINNCPNEPQLHWIDDVGANLERGFILTIDYGFAGPEYHEVVQARSQHRLLDSPFDLIGEADISVHINWSDIAQRAVERGLNLVGFTDQHHFFTGIISAPPGSTGATNMTGLTGQVLTGLESGTSQPADRRAVQTLLHPEMLGRAFQVLCLAKNVDLTNPLSGFRFGRDCRKSLALE